MGRFEPQVLESIKRSRRKVLLEDTLVLILLSLLVFGGALLAFFAFHRGQGLLVYGVLSCAIVAAVVYTLPVHRSYHRVVKIAHDFDPVSLLTFERALEAVSLGAGIDTPPIIILDVPTVNFVAFKDRGGYSVGITREAVETPILRHEAEALMANEVSHILIEDVLKPLDIWRFEALPFAFLTLLALLAAGTAVFLFLEHEGSGMNFLVFFLSCVILIWAGTITAFTLKRLNAARRQDDILADSIAVKITCDPDVLKDVIERFALQFKNAETVPLKNYCNRHLFLCPRERSKKDRFWSIKYLFLGDEYDPKVQTRWERETTDKRIDNLAAIEQGHCPAFKC